MSFLKKFKKTLGKSYILALALFLFLSAGGIAYGTDVGGTLGPADGDTGPVSPGGNNDEIGTIRGFAWMGVEINNPGNPEGGGGWLKFNCAPEDCSTDWGVRVEMDENSSQYGMLSGQAWSINYGWLSFDPTVVESCWLANPSETLNSTARALLGSGSTKSPILGWGKFVAGDDSLTDNWDGCVSFNGVEYGVFVDSATGALEGWAWGSFIGGWISFQTPECPDCDTTIVLTDLVDIDFWADAYNVPVGGGTRLKWAAQNTPLNFVSACTQYGNTSNYSHWRSNAPFLAFANVGNISVNAGNLPDGQHNINNIDQTTTYSLTCKDRDGNTLPTKYVTINVGAPVTGCMDPLATNYNPLANVPGRCTYGPVLGCTNPAAVNYNPLATQDDGSCRIGDPPVTNLNLNASPTSLVVGSGQYNVGLTWTSNNPSQLNSCVGLPIVSNGSIDGGLQTTWDGAQDSPNVTIPYLVNLAPYASSAIAGQTFVFKIRCNVSGGGQLEDSATVIMTASTTPIDPPIVDVRIMQPNSEGVGTPIAYNNETLPAAGSIVRLEWTVANVMLDTCQGTSVQFDSTSGAPFGENIDWETNSFASPTGDVLTDMTIPGVGNGLSTNFTLTCTGDDGVTEVSDTAIVCIEGQFCSSSGSGIPGYVEF